MQFPRVDQKEVFLQQRDKTKCQGKQVPISLLSAPLCEMGHQAKSISSLMHGVIGLRSPPLVQGHQNNSNAFFRKFFHVLKNPTKTPICSSDTIFFFPEQVATSKIEH